MTPKSSVENKTTSGIGNNTRNDSQMLFSIIYEPIHLGFDVLESVEHHALIMTRPFRSGHFDLK